MREKRGFSAFEDLIRVYNGKRGLHIVVVYLVVGKWRILWSFRVWRGKGTPSPAQLGLRLVKLLPQSLTQHFQPIILADTAFGSKEFLHGIRSLNYHAITGLAINRKLIDGRVLRHLHSPGQQVRLLGLKFPVTVSWYYLKRDNGKLEKRVILSTRPIKASTLKWWGKRRWQIEGWFKTAKHRFGLTSFWARDCAWYVSLADSFCDCLSHCSLDLSPYSVCITTRLGRGSTNCLRIYFSPNSRVSYVT